jgi:PHD/YefM family antitoxin component YafN of YafNO toxin-antitoxin module
MTTITVTQAARDFAGMLRRVTAKHEAVVLKRGRRAVAVMLPPDMAEMVEDLEDIHQADKAMLEYERDPSGAVTLEEYELRRGEKA